jgi:hypothetical protein
VVLQGFWREQFFISRKWALRVARPEAQQPVSQAPMIDPVVRRQIIIA